MDHFFLQTVVFGMGMGFAWLGATDALKNPALSLCYCKERLRHWYALLRCLWQDPKIRWDENELFLFSAHGSWSELRQHWSNKICVCWQQSLRPKVLWTADLCCTWCKQHFKNAGLGLSSKLGPKNTTGCSAGAGKCPHLMMLWVLICRIQNLPVTWL